MSHVMQAWTRERWNLPGVEGGENRKDVKVKVDIEWVLKEKNDFIRWKKHGEHKDISSRGKEEFEEELECQGFQMLVETLLSPRCGH